MNKQPSASLTQFPAETLMAGTLVFTLGLAVGAALCMVWLM